MDTDKLTKTFLFYFFTNIVQLQGGPIASPTVVASVKLWRRMESRTPPLLKKKIWMCASAFDGGRMRVSARQRRRKRREKRHFRLTRRLFHQHIKADDPAALLCLRLMPFTLPLLAPLLLMFLFHPAAASGSLTESAANLNPVTSPRSDQSISHNKPLLVGQWEPLPLMWSGDNADWAPGLVEIFF